MYRPEKWATRRLIYLAELAQVDNSLSFNLSKKIADYEAGADAMLTYLESQEHQDWLATEEGQTSKGQWYYIPDEQVKE